MGHSSTEVNVSLEKYLQLLRSELTKKSYIKSRKFCISVLKDLTESCDPKSNKKKLMEVFKWMLEILTVQLDPEIGSRHTLPKTPWKKISKS